MKLFLCTILFFTSLQVFAFDSKTHRLICQLAYQHLPLSKQQHMDNLLQQMPSQEQQRINHYLKRSINTKVNFVDSCIWADAIKADKKYRKYNNWHFINVLREQKTLDNSSCNKNCITYALSLHQEQFIKNESSQNSWLKLQALMFIAHWLADLHQPLHVSFKSDLGGNKTRDNSADKHCKNLHAVWDSCLIWTRKQSYQQLLSDFGAPIARSAGDTLNHSNVISWANESLQITRHPKTQYCQLNYTSLYCAPQAKAINLNEHYYTANWPVIKNRINIASTRLYAFLDEHF